MNPTSPNKYLRLMTPEQRKALDIGASCWVNASAGSGKTSLLVARIVHLLLRGVSGRTILCVTFTKRAALEMQERLDQQIALWSIQDAEQLEKEMHRILGCSPSAEDITQARGLKEVLRQDPVIIQTFHSFCHDALMRFPIEAHLNMPLDIWDQVKALHIWEQSFDTILREMEVQSAVGISVQRLVSHGIRMSVVLTEMFQQRLLPRKEYDDTDLNFSMVSFLEENPNPLPKIFNISEIDRDWIEKWSSVSRGSAIYCSLIFTKMTKNTALKNPDLQLWHQQEQETMQHLMDAQERMKKAQITQDTQLLFRQVMIQYQKTKGRSLDFDDLTLKTVELLEHSVYSGWIFHTFYHALHHILVDEAQDTSIHQWKILRYLIEAVLQNRHRTICVVGDPKQSIYGFQGADPEGFFLMRNFVKAWVLEQDGRFYDVELTVSFRSAPAILKMVNAVFSHKSCAELPFSDHTSFHTQRSGGVALWSCPLETKTSISGLDLAEQWIETLEQWKHRPFFLPSQQRFVQPEDILIILPRRTSFFKILQERLYDSQWLMGKDMRYIDDPTIRLLVSWCRAVWHHDDDVALAQLLQAIERFGPSPLLFQAAYQRGSRSLWKHCVHLAENPETHPFFAAFCSYFDRVRQSRTSQRLLDVVVQWIYHEQGGAFLQALSGTAAAQNAIDAFMQALLQWHDADDAVGFLDWVQRDDTVFKTTHKGGIQLLTIHGAKGTQAPVVIIPDLPPSLDKGDPEYWRLFYVAMTRAQDRLYFSSRKDSLWYQSAEKAMQNIQAKAIVEKDRPMGLIYTYGEISDSPTNIEKENHINLGPIHQRLQDLEMMTYPQSKKNYRTFLWLICGMHDNVWDSEECNINKAGQDKTADDKTEKYDLIDGQKPVYNASDVSTPDNHLLTVLVQEENPSFFAKDQNTKKEKDLNILAFRYRYQKRRQGAALHQLLEELPYIASNTWFETAFDFLERQGFGISHSRYWAKRVVSLLNRVDLQPLFFEARAEVEWCGPRELRRMDRILMRPKDLWIVDFKSDDRILDDWNTTPYVGQMQRYADLMKPLHPEKKLHLGILWLKSGVLQWSPDSYIWDI